MQLVTATRVIQQVADMQHMQYSPSVRYCTYSDSQDEAKEMRYEDLPFPFTHPQGFALSTLRAPLVVIAIDGKNNLNPQTASTTSHNNLPSLNLPLQLILRQQESLLITTSTTSIPAVPIIILIVGVRKILQINNLQTCMRRLPVLVFLLGSGEQESAIVFGAVEWRGESFVGCCYLVDCVCVGI